MTDVLDARIEPCGHRDLLGLEQQGDRLIAMAPLEGEGGPEDRHVVAGSRAFLLGELGALLLRDPQCVGDVDPAFDREQRAFGALETRQRRGRLDGEDRIAPDRLPRGLHALERAGIVPVAVDAARHQPCLLYTSDAADEFR
ncbi:MAG: hypothetical protein QUU85_11655, partial [Candidatus Eisenbacteria bacterium]|nr:hypothetical protein [Candidatus Eisenbacteria bacterium]